MESRYTKTKVDEEHGPTAIAIGPDGNVYVATYNGIAMNNTGMSITLNPGPIPPDVLADGEAIVAAIMAGKKPDAALARKVRDRAQRITEEIRKKHGVLNIGAKAIRDLRDA
ncbi:MAG: hypothetical protein L0211_17440 [Planctomycetaceae bacterium]|nr:hypothetical protein [Planctomycetaceae bacterium]